MAEALEDNGSTLSLLGVSLEEAAALITSANTILQDSSRVSTGLRTSALRIFTTEDSEEQLEALGEEVDGFVTKTTAAKDAIIREYTAVESNNYEGVSIIDEETGAYRNLYDILLDIAEIYEEIQETDAQVGTNRSTGLLEALAGKTQASVMAAVLSSPEILQSVKETASFAEGSAEEELSKYLDSISGKYTQLQNAAQEFWYNAIDDEVVKDILDVATKFVNIADTLINSDLTGSFTSLTTFATVWKTLSGGANSNIVSEFNGLVSSLGDFVLSGKSAKKVAEDLGSGLNSAATEAKTTSSVTKLLNTAINGLVAYGLSKAVEFVYDFINAQETLNAKVEEIASNLETETSNIDSYAAEISELNSVINSNSSSFSEVKDARADLLEIQNQLLTQYGTEAEAIQSITSAINGQISALEELKKLQYDDAELDMKTYDMSVKYFSPSYWYNRLGGFDNDYDRTIWQMEGMSGSTVSGVSDEFAALVSDLDGVNVYEMYGENVISVEGSLKQQIEHWKEISSLAESADESNLKILDEQNRLQNIYDSSSDFYSQYMEYDDEAPSRDYDTEIAELDELFERQQEAVTEGNTELAETAANEFYIKYYETLKKAEDANDYTVQDDLEERFTNLTSTFSDWELPYEYQQNVDGLRDTLESIFSDGASILSDMNDVELGAFLDSELFTGQIVGYKELNTVMADFGITAEQLTSILVELGLVQTQLQDLFGDKYYDLGIDSLTDEQRTILSENIGNYNINDFASHQAIVDYIDSIVSVAEEAVDEVDAYVSDVARNISDYVEPQLSSIQDLYQEIFSEDDGFVIGGATNESVQALLDAVTDLPDEINEAFDPAIVDDFLNTIGNSSTTAEEAQAAFDNLASAYIDASGILDDINETTVDYAEAQLEALGVVNAAEVAESALATRKAELIDATKDLANTTTDEALALVQEQGEAQNCAAELATLYLKKAIFNQNILDTSADINNLIALAETAGMTATALSQLATVRAGLAEAQASGDARAISEYNKAASALAQQIKDQVANYSPTHVEVGSTSSGSSSSGGGSSSSSDDDEDDYLDKYEEEKEALQRLRDQDEISEMEYLRRLRTLYSQHFADREEYLEEYEDEEREYLEDLKDLYDDVFGYIIDLYDERIDALEDAKDSAVDGLEAEKDAAHDAYQAQIDGIESQIDALERQKKEYDKQIEALEEQKDAYQDQIDALNDEIDAIKEANEERERQLNLQQALYDLERAQNQRTNLVYTSEGGYEYQIDEDAVSEAQEAVADAEQEIQIAEIEKQIDALEDLQDAIDDEIEAIEKMQDAIDDQIDMLNDQIEAIEKAMDASDDYYDNLIEQTEAYYDAQIEAMEAMQERYQSLTDMYEDAQLKQALLDMGFTEDQILTDAGEIFTQLAAQYSNVLKDMSAGNTDLQAQLSAMTGLPFDQLTGHLTETVSEFSELSGLDLTQAVNSMQSLSDGMISSSEAAAMLMAAMTGVATSSGTEGGDEGGDAAAGATSSGKSMAAALTEIGTVGKTTTDNLSTGFEADTEAATAFNEILSGGGSSEDGGSGEGEGEAKSSGSSKKSSSEGGEGELGEVSGSNVVESLQSVGSVGEQTSGKLQDELNTTTEATDEATKQMVEDFNTLVVGDEAPLPKAAAALEEIYNRLVDISKFDGVDIDITVRGGGLASGTVGSAFAKGTVGNAYAKGYPGLSNPELAVRSEYGQPELTVYPNGQYELTNEPVLSHLPKDTVVFNEEQTRRIMNNHGKFGRTFGSGTIVDLPSTNLLSKVLDTSSLASNSPFNTTTTAINKLAQELSKINSNMQTVQNVQHVWNVSLPNVTDSTSATQLMRDLQLLSSKKMQYF